MNIQSHINIYKLFRLIVSSCIVLFAGCSVIHESTNYNLKGVGQEPSWNVIINNDSLSFINLTDTINFSSYEYGTNEDRIIFNAKKRNKSIKIIFNKQECEDTMSGEIFPYRVTVTFDTLLLTGCGRNVQPDSTNSKKEK